MESNLYQKINIYQENLNSYFQEYYLIKENSIFKMKIGKKKTEIFIKCKNYSISFNKEELSLLIKMSFNSINEVYEFIINIFEKNKVII